MITRFDSRGNAVPVTVIFASTNLVVGQRLLDRDGYSALQVGFETAKKPKNPQKKGYKDLKFVPKTVREFRVTLDESSLPIGSELSVADFTSGDVLKVTGTSKGKGFAGVVKRWGFAGGPRTHGQSDRERAPGSIGATSSPGRVFKGKKMAGHTGNAQVTVSGIVVYDTDPENNLLLVRGAIPGPNNSLLLIEKVGSKKPLVEAKVIEEPEAVEEASSKEASENNNIQATEAIEEVGVEETPEQIEESATQVVTEEGESVQTTNAEENSSDSPTPPELKNQESK